MAQLGKGTLVAVGDGASPEVFTTFAQITRVNPPSASADAIETTHMETPGDEREYIPGLINRGECEFDMNYVPGSPTDLLLEAWFGSSPRLRNCRLSYRNGRILDFEGFVTNYSKEAVVDDKMNASCTIKLRRSVAGTGP